MMKLLQRVCSSSSLLLALWYTVAASLISTTNAFLVPSSSSSSSSRRLINHHNSICLSPSSSLLLLSSTTTSNEEAETTNTGETSSSSSSDTDDAFSWQKDSFDLETAIFCSGLAFDSYVEPPSNSSRWERGSKGMDVAFLSKAFTRNLYKGIIQVTPKRVTGLPDESSTVEGLATGGGSDAYITVAAIEGQWQEDINLLEKQQYHEGIRDLSGAAHVGRSSTAWANINENYSNAQKRKGKKAPAYHIKSSWGKDGQAVWTDDEEPFYLYVQDPTNVRLVFTVMDDDVVGEGKAIGSAHKKLTELIPEAKFQHSEYVECLKKEVMEKLKDKNLEDIDLDSEISKVNLGARTWEGSIKLTSKPRKKDKKGQVAMGMAAGAALAGPMGAAVGGAMMNMYEGDVKGSIDLKLSYMPMPATPVKREKYTVLGGMPGITWGKLYEKYLETLKSAAESGDDEAAMKAIEMIEDEHDSESQNNKLAPMAGHLFCKDLEQCFFINHQQTGGCCVVYRSLEKKLIVVSFRGTCVPKDLVTDVLLVQDAWVEGEDVTDPEVAKVHAGFRTSMDSISRRLKELVLATVAPGDDISEYDMLITGHSLGKSVCMRFFVFFS